MAPGKIPGGPVGQALPRHNTSGTDQAPPLEVMQMGWCWGAFGLHWIWGIANQVWVSFLTLVPCVGFGVAIWLGISGHRMAWQKRSFASVDQYRDTMRVWNNWGLGIFIVSVVLGIIPVGAGILFPPLAAAREKARQVSCLANEKQITLAILQFCQDNKGCFPPAAGWREALAPYVRDTHVFECPTGRTYGFNTNLAGYSLDAIKQPRSTGVIFEADASGNPIYPHRGGANIGFADGHCAWQTEEQAKGEIVW